MIENIFLNFNELSELLAEIDVAQKEQTQNLDDPVRQTTFLKICNLIYIDLGRAMQVTNIKKTTNFRRNQ